MIVKSHHSGMNGKNIAKGWGQIRSGAAELDQAPIWDAGVNGGRLVCYTPELASGVCVCVC